MNASASSSSSHATAAWLSGLIDVAAAPYRPAGRFEQEDIRSAPFGILDVLHHIDRPAQDAGLHRVREALAPCGVLLLRMGDAAAGLPFRISNWVDFIVTRARGHRTEHLYCRTLEEWMQALQALGFTVKPMSQGTPFANVLLVATVGAPGTTS